VSGRKSANYTTQMPGEEKEKRACRSKTGPFITNATMYSGATHGVTAGEATVAGPVANGKGAALAYNTDGSVCKSNNNRQIIRGH